MIRETVIGIDIVVISSWTWMYWQYYLLYATIVSGCCDNTKGQTNIVTYIQEVITIRCKQGTNALIVTVLEMCKFEAFLDHSMVVKYTKITEVNLSVFAYRLFREDISPIVGTNLDIEQIQDIEQIWICSDDWREIFK